jgi:molecular chaperone DnaK
VEKNVKEFGDKVDAAEKTKIEEAITKTKKALEGDDLDAIKKAQDELMNVSHKLAEAMYAKTAGGQGGGPQAGGPQAGAGGASQQAGGQQASGKKDDDVVDADFEEVK